MGDSIEKVQSNSLVDNIPSDVTWRKFGLQSGYTYSNAHIILEATDVYEKHWFDAGVNVGVVVEICKPNINNPWIIYHATQISVNGAQMTMTEYVLNGDGFNTPEYNSAVNTIRNSVSRPSNLNDFVREYMQSK